ncbi:MAG: hypothetical protein K8L97_14395, partial [Anaerolineae bacterium]|nr:hypothetical protein [Anaerolineae bacterium]
MKIRLLLVLLIILIAGTIRAQDEIEYVEIGQIGRGAIDKLYWSPDGTRIAVTTIRGLWIYQADNLTIPPRLIELDYGTLTEPDYSRWAEPDLSETRPLPFPNIDRMPR